MEPLNMRQIRRRINEEDNAVWIKDLYGRELCPIRALLYPPYAESYPRNWYYEDYGTTWVAYKDKPTQHEMTIGVKRYA